MRALLISLAVFVGCSTPEGELAEPALVELPFRITSIEDRVVLPGTRARITGAGFIEAIVYSASFEGQGDQGAISMALGVEFVDDTHLDIVFPVDVVVATSPGELRGTLTVIGQNADAYGRAELSLFSALAHSLTPRIDGGAQGLFPGSPVTIQGDGFITGGEGQTLFRIRGTFTDERSNQRRQITVDDAIGSPPYADDWRRDTLRFIVDPAWFGIQPGLVDGEIQAVNEGAGWRAESEWVAFRADQLPPTINALSVSAASRGQAIGIEGHGFVGGPLGGFTVLRITGTFTTRGGTTLPLPVGGLELTPSWRDGDALVFTMLPEYSFDCTSTDLGGAPGRVEGAIVPITTYGGEEVEGAGTTLDFEILPSKQIIWLRFLPAFTDSLRLFGLRNFSRQVRDRVVAIIERDFGGINLEVRLSEPTDWVAYGIVEIGGPDPNATNAGAPQLFGLDNTPGLDDCNERLDDKLAGVNLDSGGTFGGIFVESFRQLSPRNGTSNPLASPVFDTIFDPFDPERGEIAAPDALGGDRGPQLTEAIRVLGNLIGNTATHEIGHSLGLPAFPGCGAYHNAPGDRQIMDCGADRPFAERAELVEGTGAIWTPENRAYLEQILPVR